jgi:hypothetical protein
MTEDRSRVPEETRAVWDALDALAPERLPADASNRIERVLTPALIALSSRGGLMTGSRNTLAAALALALVAGGAAGFGIGATRGERGAATPPSPGEPYLLLVHDNEAVDRAVAEQGMEAIVERYAAWARGLAEQGRLVSAEHLTPTPHWIGQAMPAASSISGFFLIRAASRDEAVDIAGRSPHVELGGVIEVRGVEGSGR